MAGVLKIKNWAEFQHYKDRSPPWIKLHNAILEDYAFAQLPDDTKGHLMLIWMLASRIGKAGTVPDDPGWISSMISASSPVRVDLLVAAGFLIPQPVAAQPLRSPAAQDASAALAQRKPSRARGEAETETEAEITDSVSNETGASADVEKSETHIQRGMPLLRELGYDVAGNESKTSASILRQWEEKGRPWEECEARIRGLALLRDRQQLADAFGIPPSALRLRVLNHDKAVIGKRPLYDVARETWEAQEAKLGTANGTDRGLVRAGKARR